MNTPSKLQTDLQKNKTLFKKLLPAEDILTYDFQTADGVACTLIYADGIVNKELLAQLVAKPLSSLYLHEKAGGMYASNENPVKDAVAQTERFPELKVLEKPQDMLLEVLDGNTLLLVDGLSTGFVVGAKFLPVRAIMEPPTDVAVKGPREGFIEDIKVNMSLVRKRFKTPDLRFETVRVGRRSQTAVVVCWLDGTSKAELKDEVVQKLNALDLDIVPDSSYIATLLSPRKHSFFRAVGTTEKPDIFTAKIAVVLESRSRLSPSSISEPIISAMYFFPPTFVCFLTRYGSSLAVLSFLTAPP